METGFELTIDATPSSQPHGRSQATLLLDALEHYRDRQWKDLQEELHTYTQERGTDVSELHQSIEAGYLYSQFRAIDHLNTLISQLTDSLDTLMTDWFRQQS